MGKRSTFPRLPQDSYATPFEAVEPLLKRLSPSTRFIEPCAGDGRLIEHLERAGHVCVARFDLPVDATIARYDTEGADAFITNSPWRRDVLHPLIANLSNQLPAWLLIDADWAHTLQSAQFQSRLKAIVSVGRVRWFPESKMTGKDNCAWHLFSRPKPDVDSGMILYHFTNLQALMGDNAAASFWGESWTPGEKELDLSLAEPGSILASGLRPVKTDDYDHMLRTPLPPCVWLSSDPEMAGDFSARQGFRLSIMIPSADCRLVLWSKFLHKKSMVNIEAAVDGRMTRAAAQFWLYFGTITPDRFRGLGLAAGGSAASANEAA